MKSAWEALFALVDEIAERATPEEIEETWARVKAKNLGGPTVEEYTRMMGFSTWYFNTTVTVSVSDLPAVEFEHVHAACAISPYMNIGEQVSICFGEHMQRPNIAA